MSYNQVTQSFGLVCALILGYPVCIFHAIDTKYMFCVGWRKSLKGSTTPESKTIVFWKQHMKKLFCGTNVIAVVNAYKDLGLYFTMKLQFSTACSNLAARGKRAVMGILSVLYKFENQSMIYFGKPFYSEV